MTKSAQAFRTIREVAEWLDVAAHVLRFWESKFSQIKPVKRAGGRRYYRPADMELVGGIKVLLHDRGLTIRGVQKMIADEGLEAVACLSPPIDTLIGDGEVFDMETPDAWAADTAAEADETPELTTAQEPEPAAEPEGSPPPPEPATPAATGPIDPPAEHAKTLPAANPAEGALGALAMLAQLPTPQRAALRPQIKALAHLRDRMSGRSTTG